MTFPILLCYNAGNKPEEELPDKDAFLNRIGRVGS